MTSLSPQRLPFIPNPQKSQCLYNFMIETGKKDEKKLNLFPIPTSCSLRNNPNHPLHPNITY